VKAHADIDPGPITGAKDPSDWDNTLKQITVDVTHTETSRATSGRRSRMGEALTGALNVQQDRPAQDELPLRVKSGRNT